MPLMNFLNFDKFFNRSELNLPIRLGDEDYYHTLENLFNYYLDGLRGKLINPYEAEESDLRRIDIAGKYSDIKTICNTILAAVKTYQDGFPNEAYKQICNVMSLLTIDNRTLAVYSKNAIGGTEPAHGTRLYRVRSVKENKKYHKKEIFHVPYALRAYVDTNRYSIAGFPSLYLSSTLNLCIAEAELSEFNDFQIAAEFQFIRDYNDTFIPIKVFELAIKPQDFFKTSLQEQNVRSFPDGELENLEIRKNYLFWYPLIAACSFMRKNRKAPFAVEYIVPQLLMQWLRSENKNNGLNGIRYFSCKTERLSDMGFNYVFPVSGQDFPEMKGYCSQLRLCFRLTEPINMCDFENVFDAIKKLSSMSKDNLLP